MISLLDICEAFVEMERADVVRGVREVCNFVVMKRWRG